VNVQKMTDAEVLAISNGRQAPLIRAFAEEIVRLREALREVKEVARSPRLDRAARESVIEISARAL
jgi:hypothetical protein